MRKNRCDLVTSVENSDAFGLRNLLSNQSLASAALFWLMAAVSSSAQMMDQYQRDQTEDRNAPVEKLEDSRNIGGRRADLEVGAIMARETVRWNQSVDLSFAIINSGTGTARGTIAVGVWLSIDGIPFNNNGDDLPIGGFCRSLDLVRESSLAVTFQTLPVPMNATPGLQKLVVCLDTSDFDCQPRDPCRFESSPRCQRWLACNGICELDENTNNCAAVDIRVLAPDAGVESIDAPDSAISGEMVTIGCTVTNQGPDTLNIPCRICIGGDPFNCSTCFANNVPSLALGTCSVEVLAPPSTPNCGGPQTFQLGACTTLDIDSDRSNDCLFQQIALRDPYWDLNLEIFDVPASATILPCTGPPGNITWRIRATNVGNVRSQPQCVVTGINCTSGAGQWGCNLGTLSVDVPALDPINENPSAVFTHTVNYSILCGAAAQTQFAKVEINYMRCFDNCTANNNYDEDSITLRR